MLAWFFRKLFFGLLMFLFGAYTIGSAVLVVAAPFMEGEGQIIVAMVGLLMALLFGWLFKKAWRAYNKQPHRKLEAHQVQAKAASPVQEPPTKAEPKPEKERSPGRMPDLAAAVSIEVKKVEPEAEVPVPKGAEISYLDAEAIKFWNKKKTDFEVPAYYQESAFGRNVVTALPRLLSAGYLELGDLRQRISLKTVPELKAILADRELKVSGKKKELVERLLDNFDKEDLEELFPVGVYQITEKGQEALEPYEIIEENNKYNLGLSYYRLIKERDACPDDTNEEILARLLLEDVQQCFKTQNEIGFQQIAARAAHFMRGIGEFEKSFELYSLAFFVWRREVVKYDLSSDDVQTYYMAKNLEEAGQLCGYDFEKVLSAFQETLKQQNPFGLANTGNIAEAVQDFTSALGIERK